MKRSTLVGGIAVGFILAITVPAPAFAGPVQVTPWADSFTIVHEVGEEGWCDPEIVDFEVTETFEGRGIDRITTQPDGIIRYAGTYRVQSTYTADGSDFVVETHGNTRDTEIVDNGDGTLTIWFKDATTTKVWFDGTFLFHDSGLVEGASLVDHNGTPTIPDDDEFLGPVGEIGLHGHFDTADRDFCEDIAIYLGD
jgi:hypothetical protein